MLTQALGRSGYQVRSTGNAATLWRWVEEGEGDLVITDVVMPDENGLDLIPRIKRIRPDLRGDRDERAIDPDDRGQGTAARRLRLSAQAVRSAGSAGGGRPRSGSRRRTAHGGRPSHATPTNRCR